MCVCVCIYIYIYIYIYKIDVAEKKKIFGVVNKTRLLEYVFTRINSICFLIFLCNFNIDVEVHIVSILMFFSVYTIFSAYICNIYWDSLCTFSVYIAVKLQNRVCTQFV